MKLGIYSTVTGVRQIAEKRAGSPARVLVIDAKIPPVSIKDFV